MRTTIYLPPSRTMTVTATADAKLSQLSGSGEPTAIADISAGASSTVAATTEGRVYAVDSTSPPTVAITVPANAEATAATESLSSTVDDTLADGVDIALGTTTGSKIGTAAAQKLGFWGATPVIQQASANQAVATISTVEDKAASISIGTPPNHLVITADTAGTAGNAITVEAVLDAAPSQPLTAGIVGDAITITLGTDGDGLADPAKNTATLAAAAVTALAGVSAAAQGTGASVITPFAAANLSGGKTADTVATENFTALNTLLTAIRSALVTIGAIKGSA